MKDAQWSNLKLRGESVELRNISTIVVSKSKLLTLLNGQVSHCQCHGVSREDVVSTIDMLAVDGQASAAGYCYDSFDII